MNYEFSPRNSPILPDLPIQPSALTQKTVECEVDINKKWFNLEDLDRGSPFVTQKYLST